MVFEARNKKAQKMTAGEVAELRQLYGQGATQGELCRRFGIYVGQVGRIVRGESWQAGAGARMPTQEESDATLGRLLALQQAVNDGLVEPPAPPPKPAPIEPLAPELQAKVDLFLGKRKEVPDAGY